jgi:hypothetical protein
MFGEHQFDLASARRRLARDVSGWTPDELAAGLRDLAALRNALDACEARVLAAFDASGGWKSDGAVDAASWLRATTGVSARDATGRVAAAAVLSDLPATLGALADGEITAEHAVTLARAAQRTPAVADHEASLLAIASGQGVDAFAKSVRRHEQLLTDDGGAARAMRQHERRSLTTTKTADGMTLVQARLAPIAATTFITVLDRIAEELWRSDSDEARIVGLHMRRADALVELARRADAVDPTTQGLRRPDPALYALIDHRVLVDELTGAGVCCQLADGTPISPATARRLACTAGIIPAVLGGDSVPLDWGRARRLATPAQKLALMIRDGDTCVFPNCDRPWTWCDAHHLTEFPRGPSDLENLALVCDTHHHFVHEGRWTLRHESDGGWLARGPTGVQLHRPPLPPRLLDAPERAPEQAAEPCTDAVQLDLAGIAS